MMTDCGLKGKVPLQTNKILPLMFAVWSGIDPSGAGGGSVRE